MRTYYSLLFFLLLLQGLQSQPLIGAWEASIELEGEKLKNIVIFSDKHQVSTFYNNTTGAFVSTNGGTWSIQEGHLISETVEFDSKTPERVGATSTFEIELTDTTLKIKDHPYVWKRIDNGTPGLLHGAWLMSGRKRNGEFQTRDTNRPRKTMKILSGSRFQWIAYNTETKQFIATGGGNYTTINGKYTEHIKFFSRDVARVGASLEFDFALKEGDWHHSGFSSKGNPLYEVWSKRK